MQMNMVNIGMYADQTGLYTEDERAYFKNKLRVKVEAIAEAFENYCDTLDATEYELFYDALNDVLALCDGNDVSAICNDNK
jgi:hypothetical protein